MVASSTIAMNHASASAKMKITSRAGRRYDSTFTGSAPAGPP